MRHGRRLHRLSCRCGVSVLLLVMGFDGAVAAARPDVQSYRPAVVRFPAAAPYVTADGRIRIVGYNDMLEMMTAVDTLFTAAHPGFAFELVLKGTRTAPPALIDGISAMAPMGAPFTGADIDRCRAATGSAPLAIRVAHASLNPKARSAPLGVFVNSDNPLKSLTIPQLERVFAGGAGHIRHWGDLGLGGVWRDKEIHPVGLAPNTALGTFFADEVLAHGDFVPEFSGFPQSADVVRRVSEDPQALGFAALNLATSEIRPVALARRAGEHPSQGSAADLLAGRYPLDRYLYIYVRRDPKGRIEPVTREYIQLVLSREGQRAIASGTLGYLPLSPAEIAEERRKLG